MNISSEIFPTDGSNSSSYLFNNSSEIQNILLYIINGLLGFSTNSYVIWLIMTGTDNGLAAEFFSLNLAVCDIFLSVQTVCMVLFHKFPFLGIVVNALDGLAITGSPAFQCLICVERYLAVVHPVNFLKFKPLRYRVICSVIVWMASFGSSGIIVILYVFLPVLFLLFLFSHFFIFLFIELFCLVAVLRALKQSGPGDRRRERKDENHIKRRAFYLILITTVTLLIVYVPYIILLSLFMAADGNTTFLSISSLCFTLAGLVQPLLFLYRMRKLPFIKYQ